MAIPSVVRSTSPIYLFVSISLSECESIYLSILFPHLPSPFTHTYVSQRLLVRTTKSNNKIRPTKCCSQGKKSKIALRHARSISRVILVLFLKSPNRKVGSRGRHTASEDNSNMCLKYLLPTCIFQQVFAFPCYRYSCQCL